MMRLAAKDEWIGAKNMTVLLDRSDLEARGIRYSPQHLRRLEKKKLFPKRVRPTPGRVAWPEDEITAWQKAAIEAREPGAA